MSAVVTCSSDATANRDVLTQQQVLHALIAAMERAATTVPQDIRASLQACAESEPSETAQLHLLTSLRNFDLSASGEGLICTDTGWPYYYVVIGNSVDLAGGLSHLNDLAAEAVRRCTNKARLRSTMVHPLSRTPIDGNVGFGFPHVTVRHDEQLRGMRIIAVPKGGGGEVFGTFCRTMLSADGMTGVYKFLLDSFRDSTYAGKTCPPNVIGIGIGGTPDVCMMLAKQAAVLRLVGDRHPDPEVAAMELELLDAFNEMGVGPMGCGGVTAAMDVHVEIAATHPAATCVAFNAQCHIGRRAVVRLTPEGEQIHEENPKWFQR